MSDWAAKRFWDAASVAPADGGFTVHLDARPLRTPGKSALIVPTHDMASAIAAEWDAQTGKIDPNTMPVTRAANSAIEKVMSQKDAVIDELSGYGKSDLICYRATGPEALIDQQKAAWDPWLAWAANALDATLVTTQGVMPVDQPAAAIARLRDAVAQMDAFQLAGFHELVTISGSLVLSLAVTADKLSPQEAWDLSRVDELWQISQWGEDEEASAHAARKCQAFLAGARFFQLCLT
ncbi:ATP12 family chaperone protein [Yoonia sp. R2331]|uniref:ATP12 family chaperone protein n=1 Tax=Yoonia sp. R2331 TaxID=3237238 RepID=UPI0034E4A041